MDICDHSLSLGLTLKSKVVTSKVPISNGPQFISSLYLCLEIAQESTLLPQAKSHTSNRSNKSIQQILSSSAWEWEYLILQQTRLRNESWIYRSGSPSFHVLSLCLLNLLVHNICFCEPKRQMGFGYFFFSPTNKNF